MYKNSNNPISTPYVSNSSVIFCSSEWTVAICHHHVCHPHIILLLCTNLFTYSRKSWESCMRKEVSLGHKSLHFPYKYIYIYLWWTLPVIHSAPNNVFLTRSHRPDYELIHKEQIKGTQQLRLMGNPGQHRLSVATLMQALLHAGAYIYLSSLK